ncbi:YidC/Oxa1 family membrane protein insertase [Deinococcus yavapaiensis]|uniref:Membrane protein insertase YidC n=1 Tax=Deinococcus yavapaiensis KR-236 TaxID=694435 RepID=A0A318SLE4_9DEIO|nr:membrane protein insertase YidC [Deinococcus yavapaiensis]PYE55339.1 YidC/Oxa1 family membrane protein insertase [Deinococcus yavapaiensis KR-236]
MKRFLLPLLAAIGLGTASANVNPEWIKADFNGDGRQDVIATTNLKDVVFNDRGEIIFYHVKATAGTRFIQAKGEGQNTTYDFNRLKSQVNLVRSGSGLQVVLPGNTAKPSTVQPPRVGKNAKGQLTATFNYQQGDVSVTKSVVLQPRQFGFDVETNVTGADRYDLNFSGLARNNNPSTKAVQQGAADVRTSGSVDNVRYAALQEAINPFFDPQSQFKTALIVRPIGDTRFGATLQGGENARLTLTGLTGNARLEVYGGKNELIRLYKEDFLREPGLFRPNVFGDLSLLIAQLMDILYRFVGNWGLVIVAITVLIRLAIWPIMQNQMRYTTKLQFVQPELQKINEKYADDQQKRMEATMALYKEHNVNPAGCLPVFIQIPILAVLWNTMRNFEFNSGLFWLPDLSIPDPLYILAVLYVAANLLSIYIGTRKAPQMFKQQAFIYVIFAYFAITFPAGVTLYWILSSLVGIVQQILINRQMERTMASLNVSRVAPAGGPSVSPSAPKSSKPLPNANQGGQAKNKRQKE